MRIAIYTNILNPYRASFFNYLFLEAQTLGDELRVYAMVDQKKDRPWKYADYEKEYTRLLPNKTVYSKLTGFIHFNPTTVKELKSFRPNVVVMAGSYLQPTNHTIIRWAKRLNYKTVFWSESHFDEIRKSGKIKLVIRNCIRKLILSKMDAFWFPGKKAESFINHYRKSTAITIQVPNTIDNRFFQIAPLGKSITYNEKKVLFTPARLVEAKGIIPFIDILKHIPSSDYIWIIAGEGPLHNTIEQVAKDSGCNLHLLGQKNPDEVRKLYCEADVFLLPSISDPNPLTCIEALWMGLPLFVSENVGNSPEVIRPGKNGYVFSYKNPEDAKAKLFTLLHSDMNWFNDASSCSQMIAKESFDISQIAHQTLEKTHSLYE